MKSNPIQDASLSWAARGLYAYLSTLPNPIHESIKHLTQMNRTGFKATTSVVHELEQHDYLTRKIERAHGRVTGTLWILTVPESEASHDDDA